MGFKLVLRGFKSASQADFVSYSGRESRTTADSSAHSCSSTSEGARQESRAHYRSISALELMEQYGGMGSARPLPGTPPSESDSRLAYALVTGIFDLWVPKTYATWAYAPRRP